MTTPNDAAVDPIAVLREYADLVGDDHDGAICNCDIHEAIAAIRELVEAARLARPAGEVGWPSAYILEPAHAARLRAALRRFATGGE